MNWGPTAQPIDPRVKQLEAENAPTPRHTERFLDQSPAEVHVTLLEEQTYRCARRTLDRVLAGADEVRQRRDHARHPANTRAE